MLDIIGVPAYGLSAVGAAPEHVGVSAFDGRIVARVYDLEKFEASWACSQFVNVGNPSSAMAVASAARSLGLIDAKTVNVRMPGGVAPVRFDERNGSPARVMLFGEAQQANPPV